MQLRSQSTCTEMDVIMATAMQFNRDRERCPNHFVFNSTFK